MGTKSASTGNLFQVRNFLRLTHHQYSVASEGHISNDNVTSGVVPDHAIWLIQIKPSPHVFLFAVFN